MSPGQGGLAGLVSRAVAGQEFVRKAHVRRPALMEISTGIMLTPKKRRSNFIATCFPTGGQDELGPILSLSLPAAINLCM